MKGDVNTTSKSNDLEEMEIPLVGDGTPVELPLLGCESQYENSEITKLDAATLQGEGESSMFIDKDNHQSGRIEPKIEEKLQCKTEDKLQCKICQKLFKSKNYLRQHLRRFHSEDQGKTVTFICSYCGDSNFKTANGLAKHQRQHGIKQYVLICPDCGKGFFEQCDLRDHMNIHTGVMPYTCETCGKSFALRSRLKSHNKCHSRPHVCEECGKSYQELRHLDKHKRWHRGEKPHTCAVCGKHYSAKDHLKSHMKIHSGERNHVCTVCGKKFLTKGDVNKHLRVHSGEKPFQCEYCEMSFRQRGHLTTHIRVHKGLKPYMCTECGKTFTTSTGLKNHRIYEKGLKPYCCEICGHQFNRLDKLKRHHKTHSLHDDMRQATADNDCSTKSIFPTTIESKTNTDSNDTMSVTHDISGVNDVETETNITMNESRDVTI
ncbi:uncharacterized protein LOC141903961 [Tubulanus polymorphus]|uniref:uncharacterized protein LOC141903961 n=1 Tax=Tubulanus polymorphus TaxID=672921 RepID=UPI003DA69BB9